MGTAGEMYAQNKGAFLFGVSGHIPRLVVFSARYYVSNQFSAELSFGGAPHYVNWGAAVNYHMKKEKPRFFLKLGYAGLAGYNHFSHLDSIPENETIQIDGMAQILEFGLGREYGNEKKSNFFAAGPALWFHEKKGFMRHNRETFSKQRWTFKWLGFAEGGSFRARKKENDGEIDQ